MLNVVKEEWVQWQRLDDANDAQQQIHSKRKFDSSTGEQKKRTLVPYLASDADALVGRGISYTPVAYALAYNCRNTRSGGRV